MAAHRLNLPATRRSRLVLAICGVALVVGALSGWRLLTVFRSLTDAGERLASARTAIVQRDTPVAVRELDRAQDALRVTRRASRGFPLNVAAPIPLLGSPVRAARSVAAAGERGVAASRALVDAVASLPTRPGAALQGHDLGELHRASVASQPRLAAAVTNLRAAVQHLDGPTGAILPFVSSRAKRVRAEVVAARDTAVQGLVGLQLAADLSRPGGNARLLLVAQDTLELRPTGGFIGSFGVIQLANGVVSLERYANIADLRDANPPLEAPKGLRERLRYPWNLGNANWWPDFPTSAQAAARLFEHQGGGKVDGVIAITELTIKRLIAATGPIKVADYDIPVSDERFEDRLLYEVELKRPLDNPRKKFLTNLASAVFERVFALHPGEVTRVADSFGTSASRGDLQMWFRDAARQQLVARTVIHGGLPKPDRDFLLLADSNLSASKANRYVTKHIDYHVTPNDEGGLDAHLAIKVRDFGAKSELNPYYHSYLRVYVPKGAELLDDGEVEAIPSPAEDGDYTEFSLQAIVAAESSELFEVRYRLPASVVRGGEYGLTLVRQPGTPRDTYQVRVGGTKLTTSPRERITEIETAKPRNRLRDLLRGRSPF